MTEHYYSPEPDSASRPEQMEVQLRGHALTFFTDRGVFSKGRLDFGSQLLIHTLEVDPQAKVLDMGCGYGPIGLALAKESSSRAVTLVDTNRRALELARKNAQVNQVANVHIVESDLYAYVADDDYDVIVSNPPIRAGKKVVYTLFEQSAAHLRPGGELWIVIQKKQGAASAFKKLRECFADVREETKKKGYRIYRAKRKNDD